MKKNSLTHSFILLLVAVIWGTGFVAQSAGMDYVGPFTFGAVRNIIGGLIVVPVVIISHKISKKRTANLIQSNKDDLENEINDNIRVTEEGIRGNIKTRETELKPNKSLIKTTILAGFLCGIFLCAAENFQQAGLIYTTVGKAGFITSLYVVLVPIFGIFLKKKAPLAVWISVLLAVVGLYLLCIKGESLSVGIGDLFELVCALLFAVHIMIIDYFNPKADGLLMSCIQFFVAGILSAVLMLIFERPQVGTVLEAYIPLLYAGVLSTGIAYTLQIVGQKGVHPTIASLILCLESVISVLAGFLILGQQLSVRELIGCAVMFTAVILAQISTVGKG